MNLTKERYIEINNIQSKNENNININNFNNNNNVVNKEYSLCALFSILYPFNSNFIQSDNNNNNNKNDNNNIGGFIPDPLPKDQQLMWSDFEVEMDMESISSISDLSSQASDIAMTSDVEDDKPNSSSNKQKGNKQDKSKKRIFVGGIKFDDLGDNELLKKLRIEKLLYLFSSCGKIESVEPHWNKGFCFINFQQGGIAMRTVKQFENTAKKNKLVENIKKSLSFETQMAVPSPTFYVRMANSSTNCKNHNKKAKDKPKAVNNK